VAERKNGFWVLEYDTVSGHGVDGAASLAALEPNSGPLPATRQAECPSGQALLFPASGIRYVGTPGYDRNRTYAATATW